MSHVIANMIRIADVLDRNGNPDLAEQVDRILRLASTRPDEFERIVRFIRSLQKKGMPREKVVMMFEQTPLDPEIVMFAWVAASMMGPAPNDEE